MKEDEVDPVLVEYVTQLTTHLEQQRIQLYPEFDSTSQLINFIDKTVESVSTDDIRRIVLMAHNTSLKYLIKVVNHNFNTYH